MNNMKNVMEHILQILCRNFRTTCMFQKSRKNSSKFFLKDNCPILNCAKVQKSVKEVGGKLFTIPKCSGDLNSIENILM